MGKYQSLEFPVREMVCSIIEDSESAFDAITLAPCIKPSFELTVPDMEEVLEFWYSPTFMITVREATPPFKSETTTRTAYSPASLKLLKKLGLFRANSFV